VGGAVWKKVFGGTPGTKPGKKPDKKPPSQKPCKDGQVRNPKTGRCIKIGGKVWKEVFGSKPDSKLAAPKKRRKIRIRRKVRKKKKRTPYKRIKLKTRDTPFGEHLKRKLDTKLDCTKFEFIRKVRSYTARALIIISCVNDGIPIRAAVSMWERWVYEIKKQWAKIKERGRHLYYNLGTLYEQLQGEQKYCYMRDNSNFISELYLKGTCNCMCGTALLFALGPYLGYDQKIVKVFRPGHALLALPNPRKGYIYSFETTRKWGHAEETTLNDFIKKHEKIEAWTTDELYGSMLTFFEYAAVKQETGFYKLSQEWKLAVFRSIYPETKLTRFIETVFIDIDKFMTELPGQMNKTQNVNKLSVMYMALFIVKYPMRLHGGSKYARTVMHLQDELSAKIEKNLREDI
jgi:hypothetical protein